MEGGGRSSNIFQKLLAIVDFCSKYALKLPQGFPKLKRASFEQCSKEGCFFSRDELPKGED